MPRSAAKRRQPRRLPPLTSPMKHRGELGSDPGEVAEGQCDTWCGCGHHRPLPWSAVGGESSELRPISNRIEDNPTSPERRVKGTNQASSGNIWRSGQRSEEHTSELQSRG